MIQRIAIILIGFFLFMDQLHSQVVDTTTPFSARNSAMGNTYSAYVDDASAIFSNPAGLANIETANFVANYTNGIVLMTTPVGASAATATETDTAPTYVPFAYLGYGRRLNEWVNYGLAIFNGPGLALKYNDVNLNIPGLPAREYSGLIGVVYMAPTISFNLPYRLQFGATYLIGYHRQSVRSYFPNASGGVDYLSMDLDGWSLDQFKVGAQYEAMDDLKFGIFYRTPTTTTVKGDVDLEAVATSTTTTLSGKTTLKSVDVLNAGVSYAFLDKKALVAADFTVQFLSRVDQTTLTITDPTSGASTDTVTDYSLENYYLGSVGGEYWVTSKIPARLGYSYLSAFVPEDHANSLFYPPGTAHAVTAGSGYKKDNWAINLAYNVSFRNGTVPSTVTTAALPGDYSGTLHMAGLDFSYYF